MPAPCVLSMLVSISRAQRAAQLRQGELDKIVMGVENSENRGIRCPPPDAGCLRQSVKHHAKAAHAVIVPRLIRHLDAGGVDPGHILDVELLIVASGEEPAAAQDRIFVAEVSELPDETD